MKRVGYLSLRLFVLASLFLLPPTGARAQIVNELQVRDTTVSAGATGVVIPIDLLNQDQPLTFLSVDVLFDPALCAALVNPAGIILRKAGRTLLNPLEQTISCTDGEIRIRLGDLINASVAIPLPAPGTTDFRILEIVLGDIHPNAAGAFGLTPSPPCTSEGVPCTQRAATIQARNNLTMVTVTGVPGTLTIQPITTTTTSTFPSTTTTSSSTTTTTIPGTTCPVGQGFWKNHPAAWPVRTLMLGSQTYTEGELLALLRMPIGRSGADASLILAHQLIAAKLNLANGSDPSIGTTVADADRLLAQFGGKLPYGVGRSSVLGQSMVGDGHALASYNRARRTATCVRSSEMRRSGRRSDGRGARLVPVSALQPRKRLAARGLVGPVGSDPPRRLKWCRRDMSDGSPVCFSSETSAEPVPPGS